MHQLDHLVLDLRNDGLITNIGMGATQDQQVRLSSEGRYEVEQWLAEPDEPTDVIPLPANQVFSIGTVNVTGPVLQESTATNIITNYGTSSDALVKIVAQFREFLTAADLPDVDREAIEVDLDVIEEEGAAAQPRPKRLRALLLPSGSANWRRARWGG